MGERDDEVRVLKVEPLADSYVKVRRVTFDRRRFDGGRQTLDWEIVERGDAVAVLPYDPGRDVVLLLRQFRPPAFMAGHKAPLVEACAGMIDDGDAEATARREAEEELGVRLGEVRRLFEAFSSPGVLTERIVYFAAEYCAADRIGPGGGAAHEGEDIEVVELPLGEALAMVADGRIVNVTTIVLLQALQLERMIRGRG
jgi:nudix-type nucleoside diphosphatase (YffH/AdpP family)